METRQERKKTDKFAHIRDVWEIFLRGCRENYEPSKYVTADETILRFYGRCGFKTYIKIKPDKYGLKIVILTDSKTFYFLNGIPYLGAVPVQDQDGATEESTSASRSRSRGRGRSFSRGSEPTEEPASSSAAHETSVVPLPKPTKLILNLIEPFMLRPRILTCDN